MIKVFEAATEQFLGYPQVLHVELANPHGLSGAAARQVDECWRARSNRGDQAAKSIVVN